LFPEGITTNGKLLLGCLPVIDNAIAKWRVHVIAFKYVILQVFFASLEKCFSEFC
jgi:hypothetical protein